ncbi:cysteine--tRNA ligase [Patescibacteria group bacterium]|nr:cysteine--tRNA ligase [Patescibacteria group bacterium]MCG2701533.1 cysteine--tRNA ligase [Candidatus Parcubacteria bacterium]MBU4265264.1 cysteine--tRNA ligase [Patescibacteria group bacterium]MBU4389949.1 cysteine--tRNA ligase [Patescibacteria group bacterium]MBU4397613.1 cysteine--tRNA ligase [Patescibacteria group bacterium]
MKMRVYNTASRRKEELRTIRKGKVGIYSCGPTVYWDQHIGNMYAFLSWDVLNWVLKYIGYETKWVMNITDVGHLTSDNDTGEDKMEKGAKREGLTVWEIAKKYEKQFMESLELLNIEKPDVFCRATEHIEEQIRLAKRIEKNGFSYKTKTGLVFDTEKFKDYAKFANLKLEKLDMGNRVEVDKGKKHEWDFLLWVTNQPDHIMKWDSPWGQGFPGWHIECTAMSTKYLGELFDIHTGGMEHIPVHHTNEIAQGYGAFGKMTANYWMHNAWLSLKKGKMSKSGGGGYTVQDLVKQGFDLLALRYLVLMSHYRKGLIFSIESLKAAKNGLEKLRDFVKKSKVESRKVKSRAKIKINEKYKKLFIEKLSDDLAMPEAMAIVWKMVKDESVSLGDRLVTLMDFDRVLGLNLVSVGERGIESVPEEIKKMIKDREEFRLAQNWKEADRLRDLIKKKGFVVEDAGEKYRIKRVG